MKRVLVFSFMLFFALAMSAQENQGGQGQGQGGRRGGGQGGQRGGSAQRYEQMKKDYSLTDVQVDSIKAIDNELRVEMQKLREANGDNNGFSEQSRTAMQKINEKRNARYKKILTAEQYKKYEEEQKARMERMRQGGGPGGQGGGRPGGAPPPQN